MKDKPKKRPRAAAPEPAAAPASGASRSAAEAVSEREAGAAPEPAATEGAGRARHTLLSPAAAKLSTSVGIVAAMVLATLLNVLVARHYRRWDVTRGGLYTLSEATLATLHGLPEPVKIYLILPGGEPLTLSVQHLLDGYRAETDKLDVELVDPDHRPVDFFKLAQRYEIGGDRRDGRIVAAAAAVVVAGDRHELVRPQELIEVDAEDDLRRRPRLEQAFTGALRAVTSGDHPTACFAVGHGEDPSEPLREHLARNGYAVADVGPAKGEQAASLDACKVLIVAGPSEKVPPEDAGRWAAWLDKGGAALVAVGPHPEGAEHDFTDYGLGGLLAGFGIALDRDVVFEQDPDLLAARDQGLTFTPAPRPHPVTQPLMRHADRRALPVLTAASSLSTTGAGNAAATPLLVTSEAAFGMVDFFAWAAKGGSAVAGPRDKKGPLTVAFASERAGSRWGQGPQTPGSDAGKHRGRLVAVGASGAISGINWQRDGLRGTALFDEGAIAWLTARPPILDIPQKPASAAGLRVTDEWILATFRYVVLYMPLASMLVAFAVYLRRRGEKRGVAARPKATP